ncbi:concanavalin A-like lectin/glucanase superfamily protein [Mucilaginibacter gracilis]|uniref:Concanavalin A-like lectin/glucanase superfamily protein n=1 Tax=Mucilaginibacter gracilis TaxID=423350 RepID=A0A495IT66_9SPHI|nr:DUF1553 domain-containing protein [Mucilaginibacter gracilis]RKR79947.1 concanavalin A-like lectin/glucanase superfamily protein [Mucilaginibacter gracilis]
MLKILNSVKQLGSNKKALLIVSLAALAIYFISRSSMELPAEVEAETINLADAIDYNVDVKPILSDKCFSCHGPDAKKQKAGLRLDIDTAAYHKVTGTGLKAITPGNPAKSEMVRRILSAQADDIMPTPASHLALSPREKAVLIKWVDQGAKYKPHWAFVKPVMPDPPSVHQTKWIKNDIDNFILKKLEKENLSPSAEADKETLIRRVSFDVTGLPPSIAETDNFIKDRSAGAYEKMVDHFLASKHYGERMAAYWLDASRFADSYGYLDDRHRDTSPWRDWVIKAYNQNLPFDQFITWQLAGDLLPHATQEQILATGFNRNHKQNTEAGIIGEEFRVEYVVDRTNTLGTALMGLTIGCAKCHDHKYDPISQKDYYSMFAFFNSTFELGSPNFGDKNVVAGPTLILTDKLTDQKIADIQSFIRQLELRKNAVKPIENDIEESLAAKAIAHLTFDTQVNGLSETKKGGKRQTIKLFPNTINQALSAEATSSTIGNGVSGKSLKLTAETNVHFPPYKIGYFERYEPFGISLWLKLPQGNNHGVVFCQTDPERYGTQGYDLMVSDNKLNFRLNHAYPHDCISVFSPSALRPGQWYHIALSYDGSSRARGLKMYINGQKLNPVIAYDHLQKNIRSHPDVQKIYPFTGLTFGYRALDHALPGAELDEFMLFNNELTDADAAYLQKRLLLKLVAKTKKQRDTLNFALMQQRMRLAAVLDSAKEVMVMGDLPKPRITHVLKRGVYDNYGAEVKPRTPDAILPYPATFPKNRLGLARWLFLPDNPLTARVAVNRIWGLIFGRGLVKTTDDFGNQGEMPSHPELLDYLSIKFRQSGWDTKVIQKMILMSATYRQRSEITTEKLAADPQNIWLSRSPRFRYSAEMIRDNALAISKLLIDKIGGPSVYPYQPTGLWEALSDKSWRPIYTQATGEGLYRRSIYTVRKRTSPPPSMLIFDASDRSVCTVRQQRSSSPLQALVLLNDPQFIEASQQIAIRMLSEGGPTLNLQLNFGFRLITGRTAGTKELDLLRKMYQVGYSKYQSHPDKADKLFHIGEYKTYDHQKWCETAALADISLALMNTDEFITRK